MRQLELPELTAFRWHHQVHPTAPAVRDVARLSFCWNGVLLRVDLTACGVNTETQDALDAALLHRNKMIAAQKVNCYHSPIDVSSGQYDGKGLNRVRI